MLLCYSEQLEYILAYNYNGVKFEVPNGKHKIPMMFFPAHGKHLNLDFGKIEKFGRNVIVRYSNGVKNSDQDPAYQYVDCQCSKDYKRPTIIFCNPNALNYEQMVNMPHNFWLKMFMNLGCNVVIWNYRGFGVAKGTPSPANVRSDGESILNFL